jgi:hypothetical protein
VETVRIFVSYAREDRSDVDQIAKDLRHLGHEVWFDQHLLGGEDWWAEILRRIRGAHVYVFALSPDSVASLPCLAELEYANVTRRRLLPVMVRWTSPIALSGPLAHAQFVDYSAAGWQGLSMALTAMPPSPALPDPLPADPALPESPLARIRRRVLGTEELSRGAQHEMIDDIVREGRRSDQAAVAYDVLEALADRADLSADVGRRIQPAREELWAIVPSAERSRRSDPWAAVPPWSWAYVIGICALAIVTFGVAPLVIGLRNRGRRTRRVQAWIMILAAIGYMVLITVIVIVAPADTS